MKFYHPATIIITRQTTIITRFRITAALSGLFNFYTQLHIGKKFFAYFCKWEPLKVSSKRVNQFEVELVNIKPA